jgi:AraC-like DNA-binding protein
MLGYDFVPLRVTFRHHRTAPLATYRQAFGCATTFGADLNSVRLPVAVLDRPIRGRDANALALAENYLSAARTDAPDTDRVQHLLERLLPLNQASLVAVAAAMAVHPRVLQRRLADHSTTFEAILDDVRQALARDLSQAGLPVGQIATALGYSEQSSYTRACRRWFGITPRDLRTRGGGRGAGEWGRQPPERQIQAPIRLQSGERRKSAK